LKNAAKKKVTKHSGAGLAGVIIALMFIYLSGAVLIFGGEINQTYIAFKLRQR